MNAEDPDKVLDELEAKYGSVHRIVRRPGVHRLLVTGGDEQLMAFHMPICMTANAIERRKQTVFYTVFDDDLEAVIKVAKKTGVTVQQDSRDEGPENWVLVVAGKSAPWKSATPPGSEVKSSNSGTKPRERE